jgi:hypothetical protein
MLFHDQILLTVTNRGLWDLSWYPLDERTIQVKIINAGGSASSSKFEPIQLPEKKDLKCNVHSSCAEYSEAGCSCDFYTDFTNTITDKIPSSWEPLAGSDHFKVLTLILASNPRSRSIPNLNPNHNPILRSRLRAPWIYWVHGPAQLSRSRFKCSASGTM